jgi:hypothetical protein
MHRVSKNGPITSKILEAKAPKPHIPYKLNCRGRLWSEVPAKVECGPNLVAQRLIVMPYVPHLVLIVQWVSFDPLNRK